MKGIKIKKSGSFGFCRKIHIKRKMGKVLEPGVHRDFVLVLYIHLTCYVQSNKNIVIKNNV